MKSTPKKLVYCGNCACYVRLTGEEDYRCRKYAPRPEIENSLGSTKQIPVWPSPKPLDGCFEGTNKIRGKNANKKSEKKGNS